jgi:hypothetical protein
MGGALKSFISSIPTLLWVKSIQHWPITAERVNENETHVSFN